MVETQRPEFKLKNGCLDAAVSFGPLVLSIILLVVGVGTNNIPTGTIGMILLPVGFVWPVIKKGI